MGDVLQVREINQTLIQQENKVIILCSNCKNIENIFKGFKIILLGSLLAEKLIRYPIEKRNSMLIYELDNLLLKSNDNKLLVKDIDILFNPEYKIDVLKYFYSLARVKKVVIEWNGIISNDYLQYSEVGYLDYKRYSINKYDIICVK